jgi:hypothetical protein
VSAEVIAHICIAVLNVVTAVVSYLSGRRRERSAWLRSGADRRKPR